MSRNQTKSAARVFSHQFLHLLQTLHLPDEDLGGGVLKLALLLLRPPALDTRVTRLCKHREPAGVGEERSICSLTPDTISMYGTGN